MSISKNSGYLWITRSIENVLLKIIISGDDQALFEYQPAKKKFWKLCRERIENFSRSESHHSGYLYLLVLNERNSNSEIRLKNV